MAKQKETCLSATEHVNYNRNTDAQACYHREMIKILMDSKYFFSKINEKKINSNGNFEVYKQIKSTETPILKDTCYPILNIFAQQHFHIKPDIEPYFSHYHSEIMQLAKLSYLSALAYNTDNVFNQHSPIQKNQEKQITHDLCTLIGFEPERAFGHITTSHIFACYEILWALRNLKTLPMAVARHPKSRDLIADKKAFEIFNMPVEDILTISEQLRERKIFDDVSHLTCRGTGMTRTMHLGKLLVPISRFEFWKKAMDILGLGYDNLIALPIDETFRTDTEKTRNIIYKLIEQGEPILGVIGVLGSPNYGSIDKLKPLFELRKECEDKYNCSFYIHIDASQLGYMKSLFLDEMNQIIPYKTLYNKLQKEAPLIDLTPDIYDSFIQLSRADSVSFEPYQAGFSPYPTGVLCVKDARMRHFISNQPRICLEDTDSVQEIDGIQSASAVASMWSVHQLYPFNLVGYGHYAQIQWEARIKLEHKLDLIKIFENEDKHYEIRVLFSSDFNKLNFAVVIKDNPCLKTQNNLNKQIHDNLVLKSHYKQDLNLLTLCARNSEDAPAKFCLDCGLGETQWAEVKHLNLLQITLRDTEKYMNKHIEAGFQYIKTVILSALSS